MRKLNFFKTLLVAVGLCAGMNVWAADTSGKTVVGTTVTEIYDFNGWGLANLDAKGEATIAKASETADHTVGETAVYEITNPVGKASATLELYHRFAMSNPGTGRGSKQVLFYNSDKSGNRASLGGTAVSGKVSILDLPKDATITITNEGGAFTFQSSNVKNSGGTQVTAGETTVTSGETYTVTTAGDVDFSHGTWSGWKKVVIVYEANEEVVTAPTLELTGTNDNNRTITVTDGTSSDGTATLTTYYTTNGDTPTSSSTAVVGGGITVSTSCTIKAITISSAGGKSPITELAVEAGTPIVLNNPVISRTANTAVSISAQQSVLGTPEATIYYRIGESGDFAVYSEELTVSTHNTVYAYAAASGYANSSTISYEVDFVANNLPQTESLDRNNTFTSGGLDTSGDGIVGASTTYYPLVIDGNQWGGNIYFENTTAWGFRNSGKTWYNGSASSTNGWILVKDLKKDDIVVVRIEEGALATVNATYVEKYSYGGHHAYSVTDDGNIELRFMRKADKGNNTFYGVDQYTTTVSKSISAAGYATYCSPYALDFSGVTGLTAYVAEKDGTKVKFTPVDNVPANTGVLLKGAEGNYSIPAIASSTTDVTDNILTGVLVNTSIAVGDYGYVLMNVSNVVGFYKTDITKGFTVGANTAYIKSDKGLSRMFIGFDDEDLETTGINEVKTMKGNNAIYNLKGMKVKTAQKGLYIINGKKVVK